MLSLLWVVMLGTNLILVLVWGGGFQMSPDAGGFPVRAAMPRKVGGSFQEAPDDGKVGATKILARRLQGDPD